MWSTNTIWFEIGVVSGFFVIGHILFGHFEERTPRWRKIGKYILTLAIIVSVSSLAGRAYAFALLGLLTIPVIYVHAVWLPKKGINGLTGEPKAKYYELRGWNKDVPEGTKK